MPVIAVTGATGFIGRRFVQRMVERGRVGLRVLVRKSDQATVFSPSVTTVQGDITRPSSFADLLAEGCTVVNLVHLEGTPWSGHLHSFQALLDACVAAGAKRLVHCSTATVAGRAAADVITESTECRPGNDYEVTKLATERALLEGGAGRIEVTILRPTAVFGPGGRNLVKLADDLTGRSAALNYLVACLQSRRRMNLVHVDNVAAALSLLAESEKGVSGNTFIISDDDSPANNYQDVERQLKDCLGLPHYPVAPAGLPRAALSLALRLSGRTNTNPSRVYDCSRILEIGLARPMPFERGIVEFGGWYLRRYRAKYGLEGS
jgi:nucleoside-diphosphate-sugar epimerase